MAKKQVKGIFDECTPEQVDSMIAGTAVDVKNQLRYKVVFVIPEEQGSEKIGYSINWELQPRDVGMTDGTELVDDISRRGLLEMPTSWLNPEKDVPELLQGHRRAHALWLLYITNKALFDSMYPEGFPLKVFTEKKIGNEWLPLTEEDALVIRADHDTDALRLELTSKVEAIRLVKPFFKKAQVDKAWTTLRIMLLTWRTISRIMSRQYDTLKANVLKAKTEREKIDIIFSSQKGNYQFLRRMSEAPDALLEFYIKGQHGEAPQLKTQKDYEALSLTFKNELEADRAKVEPTGVDSTNPGQEFLNAFAKAKKENLKGDTKDVIRPYNKAEVEMLSKKLKSNTALLVIKAMARVPQAEDTLLKNYDPTTARVEAIDRKDPSGLQWVLGLIEKFGPLSKSEMASAVKCFTEPGKSEHAETAEANVKDVKPATKKVAKR